MRLRREKKLRKLTGKGSAELLAVVETPAAGHSSRGSAARALLQFGDRRGVDYLLTRFFEEEDAAALFELALAIEKTRFEGVVGPLVGALNDANVGRRRGAARALGWLFGTPCSVRGRALAQVLGDASQPSIVRETAAEGLAYAWYRGAVPVLISASKDPVAWVRFWSVFALGHYLDDWQAIGALEAALEDRVHPGGGYWPIWLEALGILGTRRVGNYWERMMEEIGRGTDPNWAEYFGG